MTGQLDPTDIAVGAAPLRLGALSLPTLLMQGVAAVAPALSLLVSFQLVAGYAGVTVPLAYLVSFAIVLMLGIVLSELAKAMPSAGGYYTYVSRALHPRVGFLVAWQYFLFVPLVPALNLAFAGFLIESTLDAEYGVRVPWWTVMLGGIIFSAVVAFRGIRLSAVAVVALGLGEIAVVMTLAAWGIVHPGPGGLSVASFQPTNAPSGRGLYLAVVFTIFAFAGWEALAPLAEETRRPRRNVPIAIVGSIVLLGVFMVLAAWGLVTGWGTDQIDTLADPQSFPPFTLARRFWGDAWFALLFAFLNSVLAVAVACTTASTRMWYAMARSGSLPRWLAYLHPINRTPVGAIAAQVVIGLCVGLGLGFWLGPRDEFITLGLVTVLALALVYASGNLAVMRFYLGPRRFEFNPLLHAVLPVLTTAALAWAVFKTFVPLPSTPYRYAPLVVGAWLAIGVAVLSVMHRRGRERWLHEAARCTDL